MSKAKIVHLLKVLFVIIVIAGLLASYIFTGAPVQQPAVYEEQPTGFDFNGPTDEPTVNGPTNAPTQTGPTTPPPAN